MIQFWVAFFRIRKLGWKYALIKITVDNVAGSRRKLMGTNNKEMMTSSHKETKKKKKKPDMCSEKKKLNLLLMLQPFFGPVSKREDREIVFSTRWRKDFLFDKP